MAKPTIYRDRFYGNLYFMYKNHILYGFDQFVGHTSRRVADVSKFGPCHGSRSGPDERSERDTYHMWYFSAFVPINL